MSCNLITRVELANLLRTSPAYISNQVSMLNEGKTIPPSIKLGKRRLWNKLTVDAWVNKKEQESAIRLNQSKSLIE